MYNKKTCGKIKTISIFILIFLVIVLIIFITVNNPVIQKKDILVATAVPRRQYTGWKCNY